MGVEIINTNRPVLIAMALVLLVFYAGDTADAAGRIYVSVQGASIQLQVIDANNYTLITSMDVGGHPLASSRDGRSIYVGRPRAVDVYNTTNNTLEKSFPLEGYTSFDDIVIGNNDRLYGMERDGRKIYIYNVTTGAKVKSVYTIPDNPMHIALSPDDTRLYVLACQKFDGNAYVSQYNLTVYDASNLNFIRAMHFNMALIDIAFSPDGSGVYLLGTNSSSGSKNAKVFKLRASDLATLKTANGTDRWPYGVIVSPDGSRVYVSENGVGNILKFDDGLTLLKTLDTDSGIEGMAISPNGKKLYVTHSGGGDLLVVDTDRLEITARPMVLGGADMLPGDIEYVNIPSFQVIQYYNFSFPSITPTPRPTITGYAFNGTGSATPEPTLSGAPEPSMAPGATDGPAASPEPGEPSTAGNVTVTTGASATGPSATATASVSVPGFYSLLAAGGFALAAGAMRIKRRPGP